MKIKELIKALLSKVFSKIGLSIQPINKDSILYEENNIYEISKEYIENEEYGAINFSEKLARINSGGEFEWPDMVALNHAIACLIGDAKKIANIGAGTGTFEWHASVDSSIRFIASEFDKECVEWCKKNRQRKNIVYCSKSMEELIKEYGKFDLAITVDVIEHIKDYASFLKGFSTLSDRAIITTPNKLRTTECFIASPPKYHQHVREWTAGEFYWVLRTFYSKVTLYSMQDPYIPQIEKIGLLSKMTPLIAVCEK